MTTKRELCCIRRRNEWDEFWTHAYAHGFQFEPQPRRRRRVSERALWTAACTLAAVFGGAVALIWSLV